MALRWPTRYVHEDLDYGVDWSQRLGGEQIVDAGAEVEDGTLDLGKQTYSTDIQTVWLSGGEKNEVSTIRVWVKTSGSPSRLMEERIVILTK